MKKHILIIEQSPEIIATYQTVLERAGYMVTKAATHEEAFAAIQEHQTFDGAIITGTLGAGEDMNTDGILVMLTEGDRKLSPVVLAADGNNRMNDRLMGAGCTHKIPNGEKHRAPAMINVLVPIPEE